MTDAERKVFVCRHCGARHEARRAGDGYELKLSYDEEAEHDETGESPVARGEGGALAAGAAGGDGAGGEPREELAGGGGGDGAGEPETVDEWLDDFWGFSGGARS